MGDVALFLALSGFVGYAAAGESPFKNAVLSLVALAAVLRVLAIRWYPNEVEQLARSLLLAGFLGLIVLIGPLRLEQAVAMVAAFVVQARFHRLGVLADAVFRDVPDETPSARTARRAILLAVLRTVVLGVLAGGVAIFAANLALLAPVPATSLYTGLALALLSLLLLGALALRPWLRPVQRAG